VYDGTRQRRTLHACCRVCMRKRKREHERERDTHLDLGVVVLDWHHPPELVACHCHAHAHRRAGWSSRGPLPRPEHRAAPGAVTGLRASRALLQGDSIACGSVTSTFPTAIAPRPQPPERPRCSARKRGSGGSCTSATRQMGAYVRCACHDPARTAAPGAVRTRASHATPSTDEGVGAVGGVTCLRPRAAPGLGAQQTVAVSVAITLSFDSA
jgi:hypothetical protein